MDLFQNYVYSNSPDIIAVTRLGYLKKYLIMKFYLTTIQSFGKIAKLLVVE